MTEVAENIEKLVDTIDTYGHVKRQMGSIDVGFCLLGGINYVSGNVICWNHPPNEERTYCERCNLKNAVRQAIGDRFIMRVNDTTPWPTLRDKLLSYAKGLR